MGDNGRSATLEEGEEPKPFSAQTEEDNVKKVQAPFKIPQEIELTSAEEAHPQLDFVMEEDSDVESLSSCGSTIQNAYARLESSDSESYKSIFLSPDTESATEEEEQPKPAEEDKENPEEIESTSFAEAAHPQPAFTIWQEDNDVESLSSCSSAIQKAYARLESCDSESESDRENTNEEVPEELYWGSSPESSPDISPNFSPELSPRLCDRLSPNLSPNPTPDTSPDVSPDSTIEPERREDDNKMSLLRQELLCPKLPKKK